MLLRFLYTFFIFTTLCGASFAIEPASEQTPPRQITTPLKPVDSIKKARNLTAIRKVATAIRSARPQTAHEQSEPEEFESVEYINPQCIQWNGMIPFTPFLDQIEFDMFGEFYLADELNVTTFETTATKQILETMWVNLGVEQQYDYPDTNRIFSGIEYDMKSVFLYGTVGIRTDGEGDLKTGFFMPF